jgi:hypothetical protein
MNKIDWSWIFPILTGVIIALLVFVIVLVVVNADSGQPFACVADADNLVLYRWGRYRTGQAISAEQWQALLTVQGVDIWCGYQCDNPFDIREDIYPVWKIKGNIDGAPMQIWLWQGVDDYYVLAIADTTIDAAGGIHGCGVHRVGKASIDDIIGARE